MKRLIPALICLFLVLSGCQSSGEDDMDAYVATALAETAAMKTLIVQGAEATFAAIPTETLIPTPTLTLTPTLTPTTTPFPPVTAELVLNAYCRPGPGTVYGQGKLLERGDKVQIIGREDDAAVWLMVQLADGSDTCWIARETLSITGETAWVETVLAPPTPTAIPNWNGTWTTWYTENAIEYVLTANFTQTGTQFAGIVTLKSSAMILKGTVSADGMSVDGTIEVHIYTSSFRLERNPNNLSQFRGKIWRGYIPPGPFCGTRISGGSKPNPCLP